MLTEAPVRLCDICGKPAANIWRDVESYEIPGYEVLHWQFIGSIHALCEEHDADSRR